MIYPRQIHGRSQQPYTGKIEPVPVMFRPRHPYPYPEDNKEEFEFWFSRAVSEADITSDYRYLPIMWTAFLVAGGYGKEKYKNHLQSYVNTLDRKIKYFTVCQYDDGPLVDFKDLDITVFGMSGGRIDYPIPLVCQPHAYLFNGYERDIFASFVGGDTHVIRHNMVRQFAHKHGCDVSFKKTSLKDFCLLLHRSVFTLCPRGYGKSSFRIAEAMQYGSIPVYISDEFVRPYNQATELGILTITPDVDAYAFLKSIPKPMITVLQDNIKRNQQHFTYVGVRQNILNHINQTK